MYLDIFEESHHGISKNQIVHITYLIIIKLN